MIVRIPRNFMFPLTTLAFIAIPVDYVNIVFTTRTRWAFLVALALYLLARRRLMLGLQTYAGAALFLYCAWCISTYTWSLVPQLSLEKAGAFAVLAVTFVSAGHDWIRDRGALRALNCLAPVTAIGLIAAASGHFSPTVAGPGNIDTIEGLTDNPNMLGSLLAMTLPLLLCTAYRYRALPQVKFIFYLLVTIVLVLLIRTHSRSAILAVGMIGMGFCLSLRLPRTAFVLALIASALFVAAAAGTTLLDVTYRSYVLKGSTVQQGILFSRDEVWQQSYENAEQGGWFGVGYGATAGDTTFQGGLTAVGYGREKGNAQLAIVEETGLVGLGLYGVLLLALFTPLIQAHRREKSRDIKVMLGIIVGTLAGFTAMSVFEAWWVAPGSPESAFFWSVAGVGLALAQKSRLAATAVAPARPLVPQPGLPAAPALSERSARG